MATASEPVWRFWNEHEQAWDEGSPEMTESSARVAATISGLMASRHKVSHMPLRVEQVCSEHPEHRAGDCGRKM